jgi:hypothetical protein
MTFFYFVSEQSNSLFVLKTLINKYIHKNKRKLFVCFVDLQKAFDSVWLSCFYVCLLFLFIEVWTSPLITRVSLLVFNHIGGVMVSVLTSNAVDRGFEPQSGQTKDYKIDICGFPIQQLFNYTRARTSQFSMKWGRDPFLY